MDIGTTEKEKEIYLSNG